MSPETRRSLFRYGIAIDLVILATGVGMLLPMPAPVLTGLFVAVVATSIWKGGVSGGGVSLLLSLIVLPLIFPNEFDASRLVEFAGAAIVTGSIVAAATAPRMRAVTAVPPANVVAFSAAPVDEAELAREAEARQGVARSVEEAAARQLEAARAAAERVAREAEMRRATEEEEARRRAAEEEQRRLEAEREEAARRQIAQELKIAQESKKPPVPPKPVSDVVRGWFETKPAPVPRPRPVNLTRSKAATPARVRPAAEKQTDRPRLLMIERRRATADTAVPRLRQRGMDVVVVERWVDAVDEIFRARPTAIVLDLEHPDFEKIRRTLTTNSADIPIIYSGRLMSEDPAGGPFATRPYDVEHLIELVLGKPAPTQKQAPAPPPPPPPVPAPAPAANPDSYLVSCFTCRVPFDALDSDWCSCLAKERTLVCLNCLLCFCKAPPSYKEKFWVEAPARLFERKTSELRRSQTALPPNPPIETLKRPLVLSVEDDVEIQTIVHHVCSNLGYGFVYATNGHDGLEVARAYQPNLILSDAFMPKLDGREMCRILKQELSDCRMVVMTGLYTDTKYRSEALKRFHVDDYVSKPIAVTDLVNLFQKHLEGVTGLPAQEDLHELHRTEIVESEIEEIALDDMLDDQPPAPPMQIRAAAPDGYEVACHNCRKTFDATRAEWCTCVGRDQTLVCAHCGGCFCKAPPAYKERFWMDAPSSLFERKMLGSKRHLTARSNPVAAEVKRPLILLVEDDENVQLIVKTVVTTMGYGFVVGADGQEGLTLAREYRPDLILSDAFMPKLDGREMCRLLKDDPSTAVTKAIIMTGLYTDRKYRNEAFSYFKVDDYVAKPLAVDDLIKLFKKHLAQEAQVPN